MTVIFSELQNQRLMGFFLTLTDVLETRLISYILISVVIASLLHLVYNVKLHPLAHVPGPLLPKLTSLWLYYHSYFGNESSIIYDVHKRYGTIVRIAPNEVDISDGNAIASIYINKGGFAKAPCYANFDFDGHQTIFSTRSMDHRNSRAKAIISLFSTKNIRDGIKIIEQCADNLVMRLQHEAQQGKGVNILRLARSFAITNASSHLFGQSDDSPITDRLSVSAYVDEAIAVGRLLYLPGWIYYWAETLLDKCCPNPHAGAALGLVDDYVEDVIENASLYSEDFPGRLLALGLGEEEVKVQCKDVIFAGTDSSGMNLAIILHQLVLHPEKFSRLKQEVDDNSRAINIQDLQSLPYLSAVVKEGMRVSMANPTRLPRIVPTSGWTFESVYLPPSTIVGCSTYQLHFDESVYEEARVFRPERWLAGSVTEEMQRNWFAFGAGPRSCLAKTLALTEIYVAVAKIVESGVLEGASVTQQRIEVFEWFNAKVKGEKIELSWSR